MDIRDLDRWFRDLLRYEVVEAVDASRNGLQVARRGREVGKVAFAVDASLESFRRAARAGAHALFVHHGLFWDRPVRLDGALYERVRFLVESDLALFAAHLPLDLHPEVGNNAGIARALGLGSLAPFGDHRGVLIGLRGELAEPHTLEEVVAALARAPGAPGSAGATVRTLPFGPPRIRTVGVVSGGAAHYAAQAIAAGLDCLVTGEPAHGVYHDCLEAGLHAIFAGHYHTETFGVRQLAARLATDTGLATEYLEVPTGL